MVPYGGRLQTDLAQNSEFKQEVIIETLSIGVWALAGGGRLLFDGKVVV